MPEKLVEPGKYVTIVYTIFDTDRNIIEQQNQPQGFIFGGPAELIGGIEKALSGRGEGECVEVEVPPAKGFGERDPDLIFTDDLDNVPESYRRIGAQVEMRNEAGETRSFNVTEITEQRITLDGNHPLAGKYLIFAVQIESVSDHKPEEDSEPSDVTTVLDPHPTLN